MPFVKGGGEGAVIRVMTLAPFFAKIGSEVHFVDTIKQDACMSVVISYL